MTQQLRSLNNELLDRPGVKIMSEIWREGKKAGDISELLSAALFTTEFFFLLNVYLKRISVRLQLLMLELRASRWR